MYIPANYSKANLTTGTHLPSTIKQRNNLTYEYWFRALYQRLCSSIVLTVPKEWEGPTKDFLYYCLFSKGFVSVFELKEYGKTFQPAQLSGYNWYYQYTKAIVTNPALKKSLTMTIGKDCELLRISPDYRGFFDVIDYYAVRLAELDNGINMAIINSKFAWMVAARNKSAANMVKVIFDKIQRGEPCVVYKEEGGIVSDVKDRQEPFHFVERSSLKQSYITSDMLIDLQTVLNAFDTEIGIPVLPYQKKERMVTSEAESKVMDATSKVITMIECYNSDAEIIKNKYGIETSAKLRFVPEEGVNDDEFSETDVDRP